MEPFRRFNPRHPTTSLVTNGRLVLVDLLGFRLTLFTLPLGPKYTLPCLMGEYETINAYGNWSFRWENANHSWAPPTGGGNDLIWGSTARWEFPGYRHGHQTGKRPAARLKHECTGKIIHKPFRTNKRQNKIAPIKKETSSRIPPSIRPFELEIHQPSSKDCPTVFRRRRCGEGGKCVGCPVQPRVTYLCCG